jgi:serine/threonine-protein kinase ATR
LKEVSQISSVEKVLGMIPPHVIAQRASECRSFPRALYHWEAYLRDEIDLTGNDPGLEREDIYQKMQKIYAEIDEPDGIEGISSYLHILDPEQQILELRKNGKWEAAQSWYELGLNDDEDDHDNQMGLLTCLRESGQHSEPLIRLMVRNDTDAS